MTVTPDQARMLTDLARATRPNGARRWDSAGVMAALKQVADRDLGEVILATIRAAANRDIDSPAVIPLAGAHWRETAATTTTPPLIVPPEDRCGICSKTRAKCPSSRVADDEHTFEPSTAKPPQIDVKRTVAALKDELAPTAPTVTRSLDDRLAAIPEDRRDPELMRLRESLRCETAADVAVETMEESKHG